MTSKNSVAAQNRYVYFPDHLVRIPGPGSSVIQNILTVFSESVFQGSISGALSDLFEPRRPEGLSDESIGSFLSRRLGSSITDNVVSAVFHGIYAGDIYKLSSRAIIPSLWETEWRHGSLMKGLYDQASGGLRPFNLEDYDILKKMGGQPPLSETLEAVKNSSVFTFKGGIGELADRLEEHLYRTPKITIQKETLVDQIDLLSSEKEETQVRTNCVPFFEIRIMMFHSNCALQVQITMKSHLAGRTCKPDFTHIISTISGSSLANIASKSSGPNLSPLSQTPAVTVMVVNIFFANPAILPVRGFGYLLPRSIPLEQNPERALGIVFDSDASIGQDDVPGTKITVMLGGHWWDDFVTYPDEGEGANMAKAIVKRHLGISKSPDAIRVSLQRNCIPQYSVGHDNRMEDASNRLAMYQGRLRVAGNSFTGIGLNDCVRAAKDVVDGLVNRTKKTGLECFVGGRKWSWAKVS